VQHAKIPAGTVALQSHTFGAQNAEPLIIILDSLIRYAKSHRTRFGFPLSEDYVLGPEFLSALTGARGLLGGNGAVAHERGRGTDSKDNGACEGMFWDAMSAGGFTEDDI